MSNIDNTNIRHDLKGIVDETQILQTELVAPILAPEVPVEQVSAKMKVMSAGEKVKEGSDTRRNSDGSLNRGKTKVGEDTYFTEPFGWEEQVDELDKLENMQYYDQQVVAGQVAHAVLMVGRERRVTAAYQNPSAHTTPIAAGNPWSDATNATPWANVEALSDEAFKQFGLEKESLTLVLSKKNIDNAMRTDEVRSDSKFTVNLDTLGIQAQINYLTSYFAVKEIVAVDGVYNTAGIGGDDSFSKVWSNAYINLVFPGLGGDMKFPGFIKQPVYTPFARDYRLDDYMENDIQALIVRAQEYRGIFTNYKFSTILTGVE